MNQLQANLHEQLQARDRLAAEPNNFMLRRWISDLVAEEVELLNEVTGEDKNDEVITADC